MWGKVGAQVQITLVLAVDRQPPHHSNLQSTLTVTFFATSTHIHHITNLKMLKIWSMKQKQQKEDAASGQSKKKKVTAVRFSNHMKEMPHANTYRRHNCGFKKVLTSL